MGLYELLIIGCMIVLNGVFASYELALASIKPSRLRDLADRRRPGARAAMAMKQRIEASLAVVQLGITIVGATAAATGGADVSQNLAPLLVDRFGLNEVTAMFLSLVLLIVPLAAATIVIGELVPKVFALRNPELVCLWLSPVIRVFFLMAYPAVWCLEYLTTRLVGVAMKFVPAPPDNAHGTRFDELRAQVDLLRASRVIGPEQERIIVRAARLSQLPVGQLMLDAEDIVTLHADASLTENIVAAHLDLHTRFPVIERPGDPRSIIGYVNIKELMYLAKTHPHNPSLREILRPLMSFCGETPASEVLRQMIAGHVHLALVRDGHGFIVGMITQEDIFEDLVGDIRDELDRIPRHVVVSGQQWIVGGGATIGKLRETLGRPELAHPLPPENTLNEWLASISVGRFKGGHTFTIDGLHILVRKVQRQRVSEALLSVAPITPPA